MSTEKTYVIYWNGQDMGHYTDFNEARVKFDELDATLAQDFATEVACSPLPSRMIHAFTVELSEWGDGYGVTVLFNAYDADDYQRDTF